MRRQGEAFKVFTFWKLIFTSGNGVIDFVVRVFLCEWWIWNKIGFQETESREEWSQGERIVFTHLNLYKTAGDQMVGLLTYHREGPLWAHVGICI